jgi:membrane protease subunit HflK
MALNDPQWGNRNNSGGPPDLDEILRKLNQKIAALMGGNKGGNTPPAGGDGNKPPANAGSGWMVLGFVALVWLGSGFYIVDASQRGVVLRFGKFLEETQPGPRWHLPFPIESKEIVNLSQVSTVEVGYRKDKPKVLQESLMLTDDQNIIDIQFAVQYYLKNASDYLFNNRYERSSDDIRASDENVRQAAETAIREVVGRSKMDFVLYEGREQVAADTTKLIQEILDRYNSGIVVSKVTMQNAQPPEQVQPAFDDAVKASQDRDRQKNEGQAYANDVVPRAKGAAARLIQEAEGYREAIAASAEGDASRFKQILVEYEKAPQVTRERMYLEMMQQVFSSTSKVMVDQQKGGNSLLYLPLDKLIQSTNPAGVVAPDVAQTPAPAVAAKPSDQQSSATTAESDAAALRARDMLSRDRGGRP